LARAAAFLQARIKGFCVGMLVLIGLSYLSLNAMNSA
jgi:hypothetical protein